MFKLDDPIWDRLEGADGMPYNPVSTLRKLERASTPEAETEVFSELWKNLHLNGSVGTCSYACVPQLVRIKEQRTPLTSDFFALITAIEIERQDTYNPRIPLYIHTDYFEALA